ncbi:MAG: hypothetical protein CME70_23290 [Halobacteriovorax sp.]|nr:hypothetical protein [Halobacteriovorax sp.]
MKFKNKLFILLSFAICSVVYQLNKRPVLGCFEKSRNSLVDKHNFSTVDGEFNEKLNHIWVVSTHSVNIDSLKEIDELNAIVIDTFIENCENYFIDADHTRDTKFFYRSSILTLDKKRGGRYMLKSKRDKKYFTKDSETNLLKAYNRE